MGWLRPYVMLVLLNVTMKLSNVSEKKKELLYMRKKIRVSPNVTKVR